MRKCECSIKADNIKNILKKELYTSISKSTGNRCLVFFTFSIINLTGLASIRVVFQYVVCHLQIWFLLFLAWKGQQFSTFRNRFLAPCCGYPPWDYLQLFYTIFLPRFLSPCVEFIAHAGIWTGSKFGIKWQFCSFRFRFK